MTYFDGFGAQYIPKEIKKSIGIKNTTPNSQRIQVYDLIMCGHFCIWSFCLKVKGWQILPTYFHQRT